MQAGKGAAASAKEKAENVAASAKAGMEKTKAALEEKGERLTAHDPMEKEMARERKEERIQQAEINKQEARERHAAEKEREHAASMTGTTGRPGTTHVPLSGTHGTTGTGHGTGGGFS